jgi:AP-4 complex subunit mu-1
MISQFYILSPRGDTIITRDFRGDIAKGMAEIFFRKVKFWVGDAPPIFNVDGITYVFIKKQGLFFVATTNRNVSPVLAVELLFKMAKVFKDYCGILNEESIRKNFVLLYEILDEMVDFGFPQTTSTEVLKSAVHNEAHLVDTPKGLLSHLPQMNPRTVSSSAVHRPVGLQTGQGGGKKNEIFVDILERITVLLNANGYVLNSCIDGSIQMKSYLAGQPELKLALNEDLVLGNGATGGPSYGSVVLDDCNFHECVDLSEFDSQRCLTFLPPEGEFAVMNYRITGEFRAPFRIFPFLEESSAYKLELVIKARADLPEQNYGGNVQFSCAMPRTASSVSTEMMPSTPGQASAEFLPAEQRLVWTIKKFQGGSEHTIKARITLTAPIGPHTKKEIGPISLSFEVPMYNVSNLQVRYLRINTRSGANQNPYRWVRYVTQSQSYVCRI